MQKDPILSMQLDWDDSDGRERHYVLTSSHESGQLQIVGTFDVGPFDTDLEVAQWAWRNITRQLALFSR